MYMGRAVTAVTLNCHPRAGEGRGRRAEEEVATYLLQVRAEEGT